MTVTTTALDAPTVSVAVGATVRIDAAATQPVAIRPAPGASRVAPVSHLHLPAGSAPFGVPWGPPSGPLPVAPSGVAPYRGAPVPTMPRPASAARRGPVAALAAAALALGLLVGGGVAVYAGSGDGPVAVTWSGATIGE